MTALTGIYAQVTIERADDSEETLEIAIGPADTFGDLQAVVERLVEAYCLGIEATAFDIQHTLLCLYDPETRTVSWEADSGPDHKMARRFAFAFEGQLEEEESDLDPWLVVRPCTRSQIQVWHQLLTLSGAQSVQAFCLDAQLSGFFAANQ